MADLLIVDFIIQARYEQAIEPIFIALQGPQGCGKTFLTARVHDVLAEKHGIRAVVLSTDDLYLPYEELKALETRNPSNKLLHGRGLPGTHDVPLGARILEELRRINDNSARTSLPNCVSIPNFDKSAHGGYGDRAVESREVAGPVDVVILEGWSMGFYSILPSELNRRYDEAISLLKAKGDATQPYFLQHPKSSLLEMNENLREYVRGWYGYFRHFIQIVPTSLNDVFTWRLEQEQTMKAKNGGKGMSDDEVKRFVARYMPAYELLLDTISTGKGIPESSDQSVPVNTSSPPWVGNTLRIILDSERRVVSSERT